MKPLNALTVTTLFTTSMLAAGCASQPEPKPEPPARIGMPNPASAYCAKMGGTLQIKDTPKGQVGICVLPDGSQVEEWELFRRDNPLSPKK